MFEPCDAARSSVDQEPDREYLERSFFILKGGACRTTITPGTHNQKKNSGSVASSMIYANRSRIAGQATGFQCRNCSRSMTEESFAARRFAAPSMGTLSGMWTKR